VAIAQKQTGIYPVEMGYGGFAAADLAGQSIRSPFL
jgi:allophanate hydrolase subunit 1